PPTAISTLSLHDALPISGTAERYDAQGIPARGEVWIDTRLADRLGATIGTRLAVGEATLTVSAIVAQDPEIAGLTFAPGPKLLLDRKSTRLNSSHLVARM